MATETKTFYPGAYVADDPAAYYNMIDATNPVGKGSANTTYASFENMPYQSGTVYWPFNASIIPAEATIDSVACKAKGSCNSSTKGSMQLYSGTVAKGSATSTKTSAAAYSLSCGTWTRAELDNIRLLTKITNTNSGSSIFYFYGADLTVTYTYQSEKFMLKLSGAYNDVARTFKKVSGIWVEQTDLANVIEDGVRYKNGGEYVSPKHTVTVTGSGDAEYGFCNVTINGVKISSPGTFVVNHLETIECQVAGMSSGGIVKVNGEQVYSGNGTYSYTVTSDCTVELIMNPEYQRGEINITTT